MFHTKYIYSPSRPVSLQPQEERNPSNGPRAAQKRRRGGDVLAGGCAGVGNGWGRSAEVTVFP